MSIDAYVCISRILLLSAAEDFLRGICCCQYTAGKQKDPKESHYASPSGQEEQTHRETEPRARDLPPAYFLETNGLRAKQKEKENRSALFPVC